LNQTIFLHIEYIELNGSLHVPRAAFHAAVTRELMGRSKPHSSGPKLIKDCPPLELTVGSVGILDSLEFTEDTAARAPLAPDEVEIQTHAIGINFQDALIALGQISDGPMGQECAGVVTRAGPDTLFQPGDRVVLAAGSTFRTFARGKVALGIPDDMPFTTGAAIPVQFATAWEAVHHLARTQKDETILVHAAAGGTGQAAIQIAQLHGATVFATVGSVAKREFLTKQYGIPDERIFYSRDASFVHGIKRATRGRVVDVVLNSLTGDGLLASMECLAPNGRFIEIGRKDIEYNSKLPIYALGRNMSFIVFDGSLLLSEHPSRSSSNLRKLVEMFSRGELRPVEPLHVYDAGEVEKVLRMVQMGTSMGKFVLQVTPESQVQVGIPFAAAQILIADIFT
jgi:NADPH:quinone reductase-like Zn-dependent oxidoreductase